MNRTPQRRIERPSFSTASAGGFDAGTSPRRGIGISRGRREWAGKRGVVTRAVRTRIPQHHRRRRAARSARIHHGGAAATVRSPGRRGRPRARRRYQALAAGAARLVSVQGLLRLRVAPPRGDDVVKNWQNGTMALRWRAAANDRSPRVVPPRQRPPAPAPAPRGARRACRRRNYRRRPS